jgi:hypothetical protein
MLQSQYKEKPSSYSFYDFSFQHIIVDRTDVIIDYAYKHDFIPIELLTMWEIFLPIGQIRIQDDNHIHTYVNGVKGTKRKGCCIRILISCFR